MQIRNRGLYKAKIKFKFNFPTFDDTYTAVSIRHLQTVFYLLLLGYILAFASVVTEILWHFIGQSGVNQPIHHYYTKRHQ